MDVRDDSALVAFQVVEVLQYRLDTLIDLVEEEAACLNALGWRALVEKLPELLGVAAHSVEGDQLAMNSECRAHV